MKKIYTLIAAAVITTSAIAQLGNGNQNAYDRDRDVAFNNTPYNHDNGRYDRDNDYRDDRRNGRYAWREREMQIARINNEYDRKIESVRRNWLMSRYKRERWIASLEDQRRDEIRSVYIRYRMSDRQNDRDYDRDDHGHGWHK